MSHLAMDALVSLGETGLEPGDAGARDHLQKCAACQAELERLHQRVARLKALAALRPSRDRWPQVAALVRAERRERRMRIGGLIGLATAASIAIAVTLSTPSSGPQVSNPEIAQAMERSQALESALTQYDPDGRVLDG